MSRAATIVTAGVPFVCTTVASAAPITAVDLAAPEAWDINAEPLLIADALVHIGGVVATSPGTLKIDLSLAPSEDDVLYHLNIIIGNWAQDLICDGIVLTILDEDYLSFAFDPGYEPLSNDFSSLEHQSHQLVFTEGEVGFGQGIDLFLGIRASGVATEHAVGQILVTPNFIPEPASVLFFGLPAALWLRRPQRFSSQGSSLPG